MLMFDALRFYAKGIYHPAGQFMDEHSDVDLPSPIRLQIAAGVFGDEGIPLEYQNLAKQQLAFAYSRFDSRVEVGRIEFSGSGYMGRETELLTTGYYQAQSYSFPYSPTTKQYDIAPRGERFWLAAGGFRGARTSYDFQWDIALTTWTGQEYALFVFKPFAWWRDYSPYWETPSLAKNWSVAAQDETTSSSPSRSPVIASDPDGDTLYLGPPVKLLMEKVKNYKYILQEPPKHAYWDKTENQVETISRWDDFYVELKEGGTADFSSSTKKSSDYSVGVTGELSIGVAMKFGRPLRKKEAGVDFSGTIGYDWSGHEETYNQGYTEYGWDFSRATKRDDVIVAEVYSYEVWRYPVYGYQELDADGNPMYGFLDIFKPSTVKTRTESGAASSFDGWEPVWENGNILSYPQDNAQFYDPSDLGSFWIPCVPSESDLACKQVNDDPVEYQKEIHQAMAWGILGSDSTAIGGKIELEESEGSGVEQTYSETLSGNADVKGYYSGKVLNATVGIGFDGNSSWSEASTAENTTTTSRSLFLTADAPNQTQEAYMYAPLLYVTQDGALKLTFAVNALGSAVGKDFWIRLYGDKYGEPGRADPALNLPYRFKATFSTNQVQNGWEPETDDIFRYHIRGFFITEPEEDPDVGGYPILTHAPVAGQEARLQVRVNNYSLSVLNGFVPDLKVRFYATAIDPIDRHEITQEIGTVRLENLNILEPQIASIKWTPQAVGLPGATQTWRVHVQLDPENGIDEIYDSDDPATYCPHETCTEDELIDPGQNNYGFREVGVVNPVIGGPIVDQPRDIQLKGDALMALNPRGKLVGGTTQAYFGKRLPIRIQALSDKTGIHYSEVLLYDGDPANGGVLIGSRRVLPGILRSTGNTVWMFWIPEKLGPHTLYAVLDEPGDDLQPGNNIARLKVVVIKPPKGSR